jgi:hypothetical protein
MDSKRLGNKPLALSSDDCERLKSKLDSVFQRLKIDEDFMQQHARSFIRANYKEFLKANDLLQEYRKFETILQNKSPDYSYHFLRVEIDSLLMDLHNKILEYRLELAQRIIAVTNSTIAYVSRIFQKKKKLQEYKKSDAPAHSLLNVTMETLISAYSDDIENLHAQKEEFDLTINDNLRARIYTLKHVLTRFFHVNGFEKTFLSYSNSRTEQLEKNVIALYKSMFERTLKEIRSDLNKSQTIQRIFCNHFHPDDVKALSNILKVLRDTVTNVENDDRESIDAWSEKIGLLRKIQHDHRNYQDEFYKAELQRRRNSTAAKKMTLMLEMIEKKLALDKNEKHVTVLSALQEKILSAQHFYLLKSGGIIEAHTPEKIDSFLVEGLLEDTSKTLQDTLTTLKDTLVKPSEKEGLAVWAKTFLQELHGLLYKPQLSNERSVALKLDVTHFSLARNLKEQSLDVLLDTFASALYPERSYRLWFFSLSPQPTTDTTNLLVELQCLVADKSDENLRQVVQLIASKSAPPAHMPILQKISDAANEIVNTPKVVVNHGRTLVSPNS